MVEVVDTHLARSMLAVSLALSEKGHVIPPKIYLTIKFLERVGSAI